MGKSKANSTLCLEQVDLFFEFFVIDVNLFTLPLDDNRFSILPSFSL